MTADPTWKGMPLDAETALALLEWQREMGVDEATLDAPVDRYAEPPRPPMAAPEPAPSAPSAPSAPEPVAGQAQGMAARARRDREREEYRHDSGDGRISAADLIERLLREQGDGR